MIQTIELIIGILSAILLIGIMVLIGLGKDISILIPILTILVGYLVGRNQDMVISYFREKLSKK